MISWQAARKLALLLPGAEERDHFGSPSFRVQGKIFAQLSAPEKPERQAIVKLSLADQAALIALDAETFSAIPQWGRHGWTYAKLDSIEPALLEDVLAKSWRQVVPKRFSAAFDRENR